MNEWARAHNEKEPTVNKVLKYKEREALNAKEVAQAVIERKAREEEAERAQQVTLEHNKRRAQQAQLEPDTTWVTGLLMLVAMLFVLLVPILTPMPKTSDGWVVKPTAEDQIARYEHDAIAAYHRYQQNPSQSFTTSAGTHVSVLGEGNGECAIMWNDSTAASENITNGVRYLDTIPSYEYYGFRGFADRFDLTGGYVINKQGCPKQFLDVDINRLKANFATSTN